MDQHGKQLQSVKDSEQGEQHAKYDNNPATYWDWAARRFGTEGEGWKAVLDCGSSVQYNRYIDFVHRRALRRFIGASKGRHVLDAGCGVGRWTTRFAKCGAHVIGVDRSQTMLGVARRSIQTQRLHGELAQMSLTHLGLRSDEFDLVACVIVLLHLKHDADFRAAIREMIRVTRPGGYILILDEIPKDRSETGQVTRHRALDDYSEAVTLAGGEIDRVEFVAVSPYRLVLNRIQNSRQPWYVKNLAIWSSYIILAAVDLVLTRWRRIPPRCWMEDRLVIVRKPMASPTSS